MSPPTQTGKKAVGGTSKVKHANLKNEDYCYP